MPTSLAQRTVGGHAKLQNLLGHAPTNLHGLHEPQGLCDLHGLHDPLGLNDPHSLALLGHTTQTLMTFLALTASVTLLASMTPMAYMNIMASVTLMAPITFMASVTLMACPFWPESNFQIKIEPFVNLRCKHVDT